MHSAPAYNETTAHQALFTAPLGDIDAQVAAAIDQEHRRQANCVELIASENIVSRAVLEAQGSVMTNKYAEGYPGRRYYGGCAHVDEVETLAIERAQALFDCQFANVQPSSGSQANQAVFLALLQPGDMIMGLALDHGGHLTHGAPPNLSGKWFKTCFYGLDRQSGLIDYDAMADMARRLRPRLMIACGSAYSRHVDFARMRAIADEVGAFLLADIAHISGLVAARAHPSPFPHAHVVTSTTHKTLRGPRGGLILTEDPALAKKINSAVFPGLQGGPLMHVIAAKAVAFGEALGEDFRRYAHAIIDNARAMAAALSEAGADIGLEIVSGGTDTHLMLVDLQGCGLTGKIAEQALGRAHITCNKNAVPFDRQKPTVTSGIRLGTPAITTRGFDRAACIKVAGLIVEVLKGALAASGDEGRNDLVEMRVRSQVMELTKAWPIYPQ